MYIYCWKSINFESIQLLLERFIMVSSAGEGEWFVIFRSFLSPFFFCNWISMYFFRLLQNTNKLCLLLLYFDLDSLGCRYLFFLSCPLCFFLDCFFIFFHSCCSHARVFGKTLLHEFHISDSHAEWYLLFPTEQLQVHNVYSVRKTKNSCALVTYPFKLNYGLEFLNYFIVLL